MKRNHPPRFNAAAIANISVAFDDEHLPSDVVVTMKNGSTFTADKISEAPIADQEGNAWRSYEARFGDRDSTSLVVGIAIGGAR